MIFEINWGQSRFFSKIFYIFQISFVNNIKSKRKKYLTLYCFSLGVNMTNETNEKYSWNPKKRELVIKTRGLDFVELADAIFGNADFVLKPDNRRDYGELRYWALALVNNVKYCLCFTPRNSKIHLITVFKANEKQWRKYYGNRS